MNCELEKKHKSSPKCISGRDRLSELPDDVIVHILSFLPAFDAVRTVLLRRFGNLWTLVQSLEFQDHEFLQTEWFSCFSLFVHNALILHKRPTINKFLLKMSTINLKEHKTAKIRLLVWMRYALSKEVKELTLDYDNIGVFSMPAFIFTNQSLVRLCLKQCTIDLPSRVHMGCLRTLVLDQVIVENGNLNEFVSGCPSLQELVLHSPKIEYEGFQVLSFSAPSIEKLEIWDFYPYRSCPSWKIDCPNIKILVFFVYQHLVEVINVPSVRELKIGLFDYDGIREEDARLFNRFLEGFQNVEVLTLAKEVEPLLTYSLITNVGFPQNSWKRVILESSNQDIRIAGICSLVRNSPSLEELIIHVNEDQVFCTRRDNNLVPQEVSSPCVAPNLKLVSIHGIGKRYDGLLQLAEFLFKSAVNLDELVIFSNQRSQLIAAEELQLFKILINIPRASTKARIVFK